jgi:hypothetical protein
MRSISSIGFGREPFAASGYGFEGTGHDNIPAVAEFPAELRWLAINLR